MFLSKYRYSTISCMHQDLSNTYQRRPILYFQMLCEQACKITQGRPSDFQSGGGGHQEKRALILEKKRTPTKGNLKAKIYNFLDIGIYPYIVITIIRDDFNICFTLYTIQDIA